MDATNIRIVQRLERNARTSYATIAQELSLSVNTVRDRILNMERKGIILGYQPLVDNQLCERPVHVMVTLRSNGRTAPLTPSDLSHPVIRAAHTSAGPINLLLEIHGKSMEEITEFVSEEIYPLGYHSAQFLLVEGDARPSATATATSSLATSDSDDEERVATVMQ